MSQRALYLLGSVACVFLVACDQKIAKTVTGPAAPKGTASCQSGTGSGSASLADAGSGSGCATTGADATNTADDGVPTFANANLKSDFNQKASTNVDLPSGYDSKVLVAKTVLTHRALWLDLNAESSDGKASILQPIAAPSFLYKDQSLISKFYSVGHRALVGLDPPTTKTLVLAYNPAISTDLADTSAMLPPDNYTMVFSRSGQILATEQAKCQALFKDQAHANAEDLGYCQGLIAGFGIFTLNQTTNELDNAFDELMKKQSIAVWEAICPSKYHALGNVSTNGSLPKPYTEQDFATGSVEALYTGTVDAISNDLSQAMYCVSEKYLVKGKLGSVIYKVGQTNFYATVRADGDTKGVINTNLFLAVPASLSQADLDKREVWLLSTDQTIVIDDDAATK